MPTKRLPMKIQRDDGVPIGAVDGTVFFKTVQGSAHFLRTPPAICSDVSAIRQARAAGADTMVVLDTETNIEYRASFLRIEEKGFAFERGHGEQIALAMKYWSDNNPSQERMF